MYGYTNKSFDALPFRFRSAERRHAARDQHLRLNCHRYLCTLIATFLLYRSLVNDRTPCVPQFSPCVTPRHVSCEIGIPYGIAISGCSRSSLARRWSLLPHDLPDRELLCSNILMSPSRRSKRAKTQHEPEPQLTMGPNVYPHPEPQFVHFPSRRSVVHSTKGIVSSTQPLATSAGIEILRKGGNAAV
jgi:hypothetical protein